MRNRTRGMIGPMEMALIALLIATLGFVGWRVMSGTDKVATADITSFDECVAAGYPVMESLPEQCAVPGGETFTNDVEGVMDPEIAVTDPTITVLDEAIDLDSTGDLSKLPKIVPESFTGYLEQKVGPWGDGCLAIYRIEKVSEVNIAGSVSNVNAKTLEGDVQNCGGGSHTVWYLAEDGWDSIGTTGVKVTCEELDTTTVVSEFIAQCYDENSAEELLLPNPNGSIKDAVS